MKTIHKTGVHAIVMNEGEYALLKTQLILAKIRWKQLGCPHNAQYVDNLLRDISKGEQ